MAARLRVSLATAVFVFSIGRMICIWQASSMSIFGLSSDARQIPGGLPVCSECSPSGTLGRFNVVVRVTGEEVHTMNIKEWDGSW